MKNTNRTIKVYYSYNFDDSFANFKQLDTNNNVADDLNQFDVFPLNNKLYEVLKIIKTPESITYLVCEYNKYLKNF